MTFVVRNADGRIAVPQPAKPGPVTRFDENGVAEVVRLRVEDGLTLQEIGDIYGVSRERIRQVLVDRLGFNPNGASSIRRQAERALAFERDVDATRQEIRKLNLGSYVALVSVERMLPGVARRVLSEAMKREGIGFGRSGVNSRIALAQILMGSGRHDDDVLLANLRDASEQVGGELSSKAYDAIAQIEGWPSAQTIYLHFPSWDDALERAGVPRAKRRKARSDIRSPEKCFADIVSFCRETGNWQPTYIAYDEWSRATNAKRNGGAPRGADRVACGAVVRRRLGGWGDILKMLQGERRLKEES